MTFRGYYQTGKIQSTEERKRLAAPNVIETWRHWGPYLSERQWGTVRECYKEHSNAWSDFVHDQARSRAYRWGEDGIAGLSDLQQFLCFAVAMWNGKDPIIKERLFGLTNSEGNHGEDVKEYYFYLDNTPTHSYMKYLYKYPYEYPYAELVNKSYSMNPLEYELINTGALDQGRYFDVFVEYAKNKAEDILIRITVCNRGNEARALHLLPTLWFRNTWSWGDSSIHKPSLQLQGDCVNGEKVIAVSDVTVTDPLTNKNVVLLPQRWLYCQACDNVLFTENETNFERFGWGGNQSLYVKDGINDHIVSNGAKSTVNPDKTGTKAAPHYLLQLGPNGTATVLLRLSDQTLAEPFSVEFSRIFQRRLQEADQFYDAICPFDRTKDAEEQDMYLVQRQAFAGMLWGKQLYHLVVYRWLHGDTMSPSAEHQYDKMMNRWPHMYAKDVLSMPDKWEYPWFAAWDLAFHTTTLAIIDPEFAKHQLELLVMEWYQHPNGQIPAYEWDFCNINPPVHAWAAWQVYEREKEMLGQGDTLFLERVFNKLNMNFTWWVNRVDKQENNIFEGGFLGLDNIRIIDKDPDGNVIEQADGTAWMAMFCLNMIKIADELVAVKSTEQSENKASKAGAAAFQYKDSLRKYLEHFMFICDAMNKLAADGLWDEQNNFFMDCANKYGRLRVYSMVGLVPLFAIEQISQKVTDPDSFYDLYGFLRWFKRNRRDVTDDNAHINLDDLLRQVTGDTAPATFSGTISLVDKTKLGFILQRMLNTDEFLSPFGIRALSKYHLSHPHVTLDNGNNLEIRYEPAESNFVKLMGGNSNWRGPVWMPMNYLIVQSLHKFGQYLGEGFKVEYPTGSGSSMTLNEIADALSLRLIQIFLRDPNTMKRPVFGEVEIFQNDPNWNDYLLFYEYFHAGDDADRYAGAGLGASHQTGWTGLVANLIQEVGVRRKAATLGIREDAPCDAR
ncbi:MAG: glucosidase [Proteobacteria bacterium]|nr:glucosidase [Pseudomonadota bacterium]